MTAAPRAIAISNLDLPDAQQLLLHDCEDCACPVSATADPPLAAAALAPAADLDGPGRWVRGREVISVGLDADHQVLFNPVGHGGAVVVNEEARRIFRCFQEPVTFGGVLQAAGAGPGVTDLLRRLSQLELIHPEGADERPEFRRGEVLTAWMHVTNACNLRCPYCYLSKTSESMSEDTGRASVDAVIAAAIREGYPAIKLKYAGGEASLNHRHLAVLHSYARERAAAAGLQLQATLLSNGVSLPAELIDMLQAESIRVMISLDGIGAAHDAQRPFASGRPSFRQVERTIASLAGKGHGPHLSITITGRNAAGVPDVVRFALERDLTFSLNFFRDNDQADGLPGLQYEEQAMIAALLGSFAVIGERLPRWSVLGTVLDRGQLLQPRQRSCGVGQDYVVIDQRGRVAKCHMEIERTLGDVFRDDPLQLVRRDTGPGTAQNLPVTEKAGCRDCTWRYWCTGGCAVATFRATGRSDIKSPNCNIYKAIYPEALRLEGMRLLRYALPAQAAGRPGSRGG
jgi:uncharacterized protein